jgi:predicted transcriptional regulator
MKKPTNHPNPILSIRIPADRLEAVDTIATRTGITRSILIRMAVDAWLADADKRLASLPIPR